MGHQHENTFPCWNHKQTLPIIQRFSYRSGTGTQKQQTLELASLADGPRIADCDSPHDLYSLPKEHESIHLPQHFSWISKRTAIFSMNRRKQPQKGTKKQHVRPTFLDLTSHRFLCFDIICQQPVTNKKLERCKFMEAPKWYGMLKVIPHRRFLQFSVAITQCNFLHVELLMEKDRLSL